jgi:N-acetylmuramoyl-L-alanine amidase
LDEGAKLGVRGDIAFAQSIKETGWFRFTGDVKSSQNNFAGIGATGNGVPGNSFPSAQIGVRAQIQHLYAYASTAPLNDTKVDPRFDYVNRGSATSWQGLNGKWASAAGYGESVIAMYNNMAAFANK